MRPSRERRRFLKQLAAGAAAAVWPPGFGGRAAPPTERVVLGVMGTNGRGNGLAQGFSRSQAAEIAYVCDVDERCIEKTLQALAGRQPKKPQGVRDFRKVLDDPAVDGLVIAAPDHWHAPATILACAAGKHVYVEKPASHNPREGELMVEAARKHARVVQLGTQNRSSPSVIEALEKLRAGKIGRVLFSRGWYTNSRPSIGRGKPVPVPAWLDYQLWQGPAPEREYRDNLIHYQWHWFWHWGTGELGNNGIHALDVCRWGLGVDYPLRVTAGGGKYHHQDDQETPDTLVVTFDFGKQGLTWEGRSCHPRGIDGSSFGISFYGESGSMIIDGPTYKVHDLAGKEIDQGKSSEGDGPHLKNFLECVRSGKRPNADIEEGHKSTLLCHLGNIAYRTGHTLNLDPATHKIAGDPEAAALWGREYRSGWEPKV
jgi:predicted dehydrogenase